MIVGTLRRVAMFDPCCCSAWGLQPEAIGQEWDEERKAC